MSTALNSVEFFPTRVTYDKGMTYECLDFERGASDTCVSIFSSQCPDFFERLERICRERRDPSYLEDAASEDHLVQYADEHAHEFAAAFTN